jgi:23S rRNA pseudouridine1911/1915/1917 synthase
MPSWLPIVFEDDRLVVVNKPADLVCHPTKGDEFSSLISRLRLYLGPGATPRLVNRLDRETSGLVLATKSSVAARELGAIWESREVEKVYHAIVHGHPAWSTVAADFPVGPDLTSPVAIKSMVRADGQPAQTLFVVRESCQNKLGRFAFVEARPLTGRKHQIRVHLARLGHPVVGDKIYGLDEDAYLSMVGKRLTHEQRARLRLPCQALHAARLALNWRGIHWRWEAAPEPWFTSFCDGPVVPRTGD